MNCKTCNKEILNKVFGTRDCCSLECRDEYRRISQAKSKQKSRQIKKMKVSTDTLDVNNTNPDELRVPEGGNDKSETLYEPYGGKLWYSLAKKYCCNFDVRAKEGYCVELFEPRKTFRKKCRDCQLGKDLMNKAKETKKRKQMKR